ncbi:MAG: glycosyltransferase family 4 protein [Bacillota bacterium]|nr:glycosyltransferase family 4 protein [Bacillota bacterium]
MRILSISAQKPHSTGSGVYLTELVNALDGLGQEQAVIAGVYPEDRVTLPEGTEFFPVFFRSGELPFPMAGMSDEMPYESIRYRDMTPEQAGLFRSAFLKSIRKAAESFRPDLILCHHLYLLTAVVREAFPGQRIFAFCHGTDLRQLQSNPLLREYILAQIQCLDHVFCLHREQKETVCRCCGLTPERVSVIGSGYNSRVFRRIPEVPAHEDFHIVFAGKLSEKKGVFSLLRAMDHLPYERDALRLTLAGGRGAADPEPLMGLVRQCPYPVALPGNLSQPHLAELLNSCDLFVLPSFYEGLPLVLAEALACGAKVLCTDLPGIREWMDENIEGHGVRFLPPPPMLDVDSPDPAALPAFERNLAQRIQEALSAPPSPLPQLGRVSWEGVARAVLRTASLPTSSVPDR